MEENEEKVAVKQEPVLGHEEPAVAVPNGLKMEQINGMHVCGVCKGAFEQLEHLARHRNASLVDKTFACCACQKCFRDGTQLNVHERSHTGEKPYECDLCHRKFSIRGNLTKHVKVHTGVRPYECDVCKRRFKQFVHMEDHKRIHSGERPFECDVCQKRFKIKMQMKKHKKTHDNGARRRGRGAGGVQCELCQAYVKKPKLQEHMDYHKTGEVVREPKCELCNKMFHGMSNLKAHIMKMHGDKVPKVRPYRCALCDKAFTDMSHLRRHKLSHAGYRPYGCTMCTMTFPNKQNRKRHMLTHVKREKEHVCDVCQRAFSLLENLIRHKRTHTGEKPYACDICGRHFAHSTSAKEHRLKHTGERPYGCLICNKRFFLNKHFYRHMRVSHSECLSAKSKRFIATNYVGKRAYKARQNNCSSSSTGSSSGTNCVAQVQEEKVEIHEEFVKCEERNVEQLEVVCDTIKKEPGV